MFHQMHCLINIRTYLWTLKFAAERNNTQEIYDTLLAPEEHHVYHCFGMSYL